MVFFPSMKRVLLFCIICVFTTIGCKQKQQPTLTLLYHEKLQYSSGSGIQYMDGKIYIIGDDSPWLLVLDTSLTQVDSIAIDNYPGSRIPKPEKQDFEDITLTGKPYGSGLLLLGSGSGHNRNWAYVLNANDTVLQKYRLDSVYSRLRKSGIKKINIEGITDINGTIVLGNRGNKSYTKNFLVFTERNFWHIPDSCMLKTALMGVNKDTANFQGISGLEYASRTDRLLLTVSTENTYSNHMDGEIGKSYLWIINDIQSKKNYTAINPDVIIDLNAADKRFTGHKIEAVTILSQVKNSMQLLMVADDDDGYTHLFKMQLDL